MLTDGKQAGGRLRRRAYDPLPMPVAVRPPAPWCHCARPALTVDHERCFFCGRPPMSYEAWLAVLPLLAIGDLELQSRAAPDRCTNCGAELDDLPYHPLRRFCSRSCRGAVDYARHHSPYRPYTFKS
jgi:hypothetical protein